MKKTNEKLRADIYGRIHKGLRKALFEFSMQAGKIDPSSLEERTRLVKTGNEVFNFLELHAQVEEQLQLPLLELVNPDLVTSDRQDHEQIEKVIANLKIELNNLVSDGVSEHQVNQFYLNLNAFIGEYLGHMHREETISAAYFIENITPAEIVDMTRKINAWTTPEQKLLAMGYFIPAISHSEQLDLLREIRHLNPGAFAAVLDQVSRYLTEPESHALMACFVDNQGE